ncbi:MULTISPECIES: UDP-N-acetylmuramoyl-L-alanyl-D-glutamate--2,6-diaminopimelate ligase [unclassified Crossiella]|uniref:UDP-N-acetylmuramoyl-L-alanyl-D-glutamate--2, 6-diaminopimelate ligase n=1 Tax=unclassified Crossiella TaxID=2620835 RepID=UPI001FFE3A29|nr:MULTISPECIES: UDP-N-acetylmuramoyl-L-alanyl-D-glutamate--2,6-diaminopimelate ligase [unclassified Crossiella]MCK2240256.1 UDP-N-acetylmuramoyl-L-alanyl-D-glutamate--2,6-diaminopimelate ligase [Crossiella sp. S99.2]MCK2253292.1 UDP-N-acetylmuramoyl-L-alanyl-D-glutamate--2,6-diaminopimelate ligase [Crossiella sp. S99.1]
MVGAVLAGDNGREHAAVRVTGATLRAQQAQPGDLFAGLPGARAHGAQFIAQAVEGGAIALFTDAAGADLPEVRAAGLPVLVHPDPRAVLGELAARIYGNPSDRLAIIGITGTSGKTTVSTLIEAGLRAAGRTTGLIGTVATVIAGDRLDSAFTTPEAPDLQALFALMLERGVSDVAMEVSSHALSLGRVAGTHFTVGAFTNLSQDHLDFHADMADYFAAKAKLFDGRADQAVVMVDGEWGRKLVTEDTVTVSLDGAATWRAADISTEATGIQRFRALGPDGIELRLAIRLPGDFNVANALLAAACLHAAGVPDAAIIEGLSSVDVPGRMERVVRGQDFTAVVDYSHKPGAVAAVLDSVREQAKDSRIIVVLGCGGDRDSAKRALMGEAATRRAELTIVTDDNPRTEDPAAIRAAMLAGALAVPESERGEVIEIGDRGAAIREAVRRAGPGDVVVVAGKGHETGQEINGVVQPFDDRQVLSGAIDAQLSGNPGGAPGVHHTEGS